MLILIKVLIMLSLLLLQRISEDKHILDEYLKYINSTYDISIDNIKVWIKCLIEYCNL